MKFQSLFGAEGGGECFQLLFHSPKLVKSLASLEGGEKAFLTLLPESKTDKISKSCFSVRHLVTPDFDIFLTADFSRQL